MFGRARPLVALVILGLSTVFLAQPEAAFAGPSQRVKEARKEAKDINKAIGRLVKLFKKIPLDQRDSVLAALKSLPDSDNDGVPNVLELKSGSVCDSDSDNDGLDDGDEYNNGTNPGRRDSDGDGVDDGGDDDGNGDGEDDSAEIEVKGLLQSSSPTSAVVGPTTFILNDSTQYRQGSVTTGLSIDDFPVGSCVEIKGTRTGSENIAVRVKSDNDCGEED